MGGRMIKQLRNWFGNPDSLFCPALFCPALFFVLLFAASGCDRNLTGNQVADAGTTQPSLIDMPVYKPQKIQLSKPATSAGDRDAEQTLALVLGASIDEFGNIESRRNEQRIMEAIAKAKSPGLDYPGAVTLAEVLAFIEASLTDQAGFIVQIRPDVSDPDIESPSFFDSVMVCDISIEAGSMTLRSALELIFREVKDSELTWIVNNETLLVTTVATAESDENLLLRSYDLSELKPMRLDRGMIYQTICEMTSPPVFWLQYGDEIGTMVVAGNHLIVRQTRIGHEAVIEVLERLKLAARASQR